MTFEHSSESNEHYTPPAIVEAARATMGGIDLDPASCHEANEVVKAREWCGPQCNIDGLTPGELAKKVFGAVFEQVIPAVTAQIGKVGDLGKDLGKGAVENAKGALDKAAGGVGDLFKKK